MTKQQQLDAITKEIVACKMCKIGKSGMAVSGEGNPDAVVVFIGEAPGRQEAATGRPFIGRSGQLLRRSIRESGLVEGEVFITSPVKYLPDRGTPTKEDIAHGKLHLDKQLDVIHPKLVVLLGSVACQGVLGQKVSILTDHGKVIRKDDRTYFITIHPAAAIRFVKFMSVLREDFKSLKALLDRLPKPS
jgi:DNA polymerase